MSAKWVRVTNRSKCPICSKPDFCEVSSDMNFVHCMRVESDRPSKNRLGGWLHRLDGKVHEPFKYLKPEEPKVTINATELMREFRAQTPGTYLARMAGTLGVSAAALMALGVAWAGPHRAAAWPMRDGFGNTVGVRLRADSGKKWAIKGSRQGIFLPDEEPQRLGLICEGATDAAAGLTLGFFTVGRPSCNGGELHIQDAFKRLKVREAVVVADNDSVGLRGAEAISKALKIPTCVWVPPCKDLREYLNLGGTRMMIEASIKSLVWRTA